MKERLLNKVYLWVRKAIKDHHLSIHHNDIRCDNCKEWFSISGVRFNHNYKNHDWGYEVKCGQCEHTSYWNCIYFPFPARCDETGKPITQK